MSAPDTQAPKLSERHLEILQHALGLDQHGRGVAYRNHFCAGPVDEPVCRKLVALGLAYVFHPNASPLPYYNIAITPDGRKAVREQSAPAPRLTRSQAGRAAIRRMEGRRAMVELEPGVLARCDGCRRNIRDESVLWWIGDEAEGTRYPYCERCYEEAERRWRIESEIRASIAGQQRQDPPRISGALMAEMDWRIERQMIQEELCQQR